MKVLFIAQRFQNPPLHGDSLIAIQWLNHLSSSHNEIDFIYFNINNNESKQIPFKVNSFAVINTSLIFWLFFPIRVFANLFRQYPISFGRYDLKALENVILKYKSNRWDVVVLVGPNLAPLSEKFQKDVATIFIPYDCFSKERMRRAFSTKNMIKRRIYLIQASHWENAEQKLYKKFDRCVVVSKAEKKCLSSSWEAEVISDSLITIPPMVSKNFLTHQRSETINPSISFSGNMSDPQSTDAVAFFYEQVFVKLKEIFPLVHWYIVGTNPSERILEIGRQDTAISITGFVKDIRPIVSQAWVYICPIRMGTGIKDRLLEAMALEMACIASPLSTQALDATKGKHFYEAVSGNDYLFLLNKLFTDKPRRIQMGKFAREYIDRKFSQENIGIKIDNLLSTLGNKNK